MVANGDDGAVLLLQLVHLQYGAGAEVNVGALVCGVHAARHFAASAWALDDLLCHWHDADDVVSDSYCPWCRRRIRGGGFGERRIIKRK